MILPLIYEKEVDYIESHIKNAVNKGWYILSKVYFFVFVITFLFTGLLCYYKNSK